MEGPLRIVYFGTAPFAVPPLRALLRDTARFSVVAVVSTPDERGNRGKLQRPPVALAADEAGVDALQPPSLKDDATVVRLKGLNADLFVVAAYGKIVPQKVLDIPRLGALNLHGSLLPSYRGASPIQAAIRDGLAETGVTLMRMDAQVDHGPMIATVTVPISDDDDHASLERKLGEAAAETLVDRISAWADGSLPETPQDHDAATFTTLLKKEDGRILWGARDAEAIARMTRAYRPWPGAFTRWTAGPRPMLLKVLEARADDRNDIAPGRIEKGADGFPAVGTKNGALTLLRVKPEGKGEMSGDDLLRGYPALAGSSFEDAAA